MPTVKISERYKQLPRLAVAAILSLLLVRFALAAGQQGKTAAPADTKTADYVGTNTCATCHKAIFKSNFENTPHFKTTLQKGHGCESCHGPGSEHVAGGGDVSKIVRFSQLSKQEASNRCLTCHRESHAQRHFSGSVHAGNDVGCLDCHSPHHAREPEHLLVRAQPSLCYGCHISVKADFARPYRHRVNEGLIQCGDCHNVHGTTTLRQVRTLPSGDG